MTYFQFNKKKLYIQLKNYEFQFFIHMNFIQLEYLKEGFLLGLFVGILRLIFVWPILHPDFRLDGAPKGLHLSR